MIQDTHELFIGRTVLILDKGQRQRKMAGLDGRCAAGVMVQTMRVVGLRGRLDEPK